MEKLTVPFTDKHAELLRQAAASGEFSCPEEAVRQAVKQWLQTRELRRLCQEGIESGFEEYYGMEELKTEVRRRLAQKASA